MLFHRIGVLGFLNTGDQNAEGNFGLMDQHAAIVWVKDNIVAFGGDPNNIVLFGDGDSSEFLSYHVVSPLTSNNLFSGIIHQSGVGYLDDNLPSNTIEMTNEVANALECNTDSNEVLMECLRNADLVELMAGSMDYMATVIIDGTFLPNQPKTLATNEILQQYRYMIGFTSGEGSTEYENVDSNVTDFQTLGTYLADQVVIAADFINAPRIQAVVEYEYMDINSDPADTDYENKIKSSAIGAFGDRYVIAPSMQTCNMTVEAGATAYAYYLVSSAGNGMDKY